MKIALLSPWPPEASGIANYAALFAAALERAGATVINPLPDLHRIGDAAAIEAAARRVPLSEVDLVHCELGGGRIRHFLLARSLLRLSPQAIATATIHDPERLAWRGWGLQRFERLPRRVQQILTVASDPLSLHRERRVAGAFRRLITLTRAGAAALERRMHLPPGRARVIPHGVASVPFRPPPQGGPLRLVFFGYLHAGKGIEDLLAAMTLFRQRRPDLAGSVTLTLAGGSRPVMLLGRREDYVERLRQEVMERNLADQIGFATDLPEPEIPALIQAHHALVLPYRDSRKISLLGRYIGSSGALSWAIACGRGALVTDSRALPEDVATGNGAVYPQGDIAALADWFARLAAERELTEHWARAAASLSETRSWSTTAQRFLALFQEVLSEAPAPHRMPAAAFGR
jgi:glycosyltransferase involved in cell wall biosynthesis